MTQSQIMSHILEISENSYFRWKKKDHIILIRLVEKYFSQEDLEEFLENGKVTKFERLEFFQNISNNYISKFNNDLLNSSNINEFSEKHPIYIFIDFIDYLSSENKKALSDSSIEEAYINFIISSDITSLEIKNMINLNINIIIQLIHKSISLIDLFSNHNKLKLHLLYSNLINQFKVINFNNYLEKNDLTFFDVSREQTEEIKNKNIDIFNQFFNDASTDFDRFCKENENNTLTEEKKEVFDYILNNFYTIP